MTTSRDWRTKQMAEAECLTCQWRCVARNAWAVGAKHARSHGHHVRIEVTTVFHYNDATPPKGIK